MVNIKDAKVQLKATGGSQWREKYPAETDIFKAGHGDVFINGQDIAGFAAVIVGSEPTYQKIAGTWQQPVEDNIPDASFLYQEDFEAMCQTSRYSSFPFFFSNLTQVIKATTKRFDADNRKAVKIVDPYNQIEVYGT